MREVQGQAKSVNALLKGEKYSVDFYQRDYKWEEKQIQELLEDLTTTFLDDYRETHSPEQVSTYGRYFLGSIIISHKEGKSYIVDGQQRLTSLTLLLLFLRNRQKDMDDRIPIDDLIFSIKHQVRSFNLDVEERRVALEALFKGEPFDGAEESESVRNMLARYEDIEHSFPDEIQGKALLFFIDWLIENVHLVEITAYSDADAYTIFETMNDRGLSLSPTDMLKGFLLASIHETYSRTAASERWKIQTQALRDLGKDVEPDFFKTWLRSQYAMSIRGTARNEAPKDFDRIGTEFHRWVRDHADDKHDDPLVLQTSSDYFKLIDTDITFYAKVYQRLIEASATTVSGWEHVLYNAKQGFTLQFLPILAPLRPTDSPETVRLKVRTVAMYLDCLLTRRSGHYHRNTYNQMYRPMFLLARAIRGMDIPELAAYLHRQLKVEEANENGDPAVPNWFGLTLQNGWAVHNILARLTQFLEVGSSLPDRFLEYVNAEGDQKYEIEHIWSNHYEEHTDEYNDLQTWQRDRNRIGGLLLVPKKFNAAYGDKPYLAKVEQYGTQNLLARSLNPVAYSLHPGFQQFRDREAMGFRPMPEFHKSELIERSNLYADLARKIWDAEQLLVEAGLA